jgi:arylsulfatase A-like enzyme
MNYIKTLNSKAINFLFPVVFCFSLISLGQMKEQPNILIIITDQQAWDAVGYAGNKTIKTPNLDRLASESVNFSNAITPTAVCVPARTSILTGRLNETTTIRQNRDALTNDCYYPTFDEILAKRGYKSEYYGKFHGPEHMARVYSNPPVEGMTGTDPIIHWEPLYVQYVQDHVKERPLKKGELYETSFYGGTIPYKLDPTDIYYDDVHSGNVPEKAGLKTLSQSVVHGVLDLPAEYTITAVQGKQTLEALDRLKDKKFVLTSSYHCPHVPITPSDPYASMYKPEDMPIAISIKDKRENSPYSPGKIFEPYDEKEKVQYMVANYYAFVTEIDDWIGKILDKMDALNLTENTLLVFVSDHGEMLGAHGMRGKFNFYEESVRVPFLIRYPNKIKPAQTITTPVSTLNIFPTVLDYAGLKNIATDGYSLKGVMEGTQDPKYDFAVSEWTWENENTPSIMIRTENWKLMTTHRKGGKNVEALYDLKNDPYELNNLLGSNPDRFKYVDRAENLRSKLLTYLNDVNYPLVEGIQQRVLIR